MTQAVQESCDLDSGRRLLGQIAQAIQISLLEMIAADDDDGDARTIQERRRRHKAFGARPPDAGHESLRKVDWLDQDAFARLKYVAEERLRFRHDHTRLDSGQPPVRHDVVSIRLWHENGNDRGLELHLYLLGQGVGDGTEIAEDRKIL
jgi:hypothetical protein